MPGAEHIASVAIRDQSISIVATSTSSHGSGSQGREKPRNVI